MSFYWKKLGKIFTPQEITNKHWLKEFAQAPSVIIFDKFIRVYFSCRPIPDKNNQYISYCGYADLNRVDLFKILSVSKLPILNLGNPGEFDEFGTYPVSVIRHNDLFYAYYAGWTRCESVPFNVAIGIAQSADGISFHKIGKGPILSYSLDEPFILSGPKIRKYHDQWYLWYIAGRKWKIVNSKPEPIYKIRLATSKDGLAWKKLNRDIIPNRLEEDEAQASPDVFSQTINIICSFAIAIVKTFAKKTMATALDMLIHKI